MRVVGDRLGHVAAADGVTEPLVAPVRLPRVVPVQPLHRRRKRAFHGVEDRVIVSRQQAEADADDVFEREHPCELDDEDAAVDVVTEERIRLRRAGGDVVEPGVNRPRFRCHAGDNAGTAPSAPVSVTRFRELAQKRPISCAVSDTKQSRSV
jgi:hypothetical protein